MADVKSIEFRACRICRRRTVHLVTRSKDGMGRTRATIAECREHQEWSDGRIDVLRDGEWVTVTPAASS